MEIILKSLIILAMFMSLKLTVISEQFNLMNDDEIENKLRLLKEQNQSKTRFIDNLTHEIRNAFNL